MLTTTDYFYTQASSPQRAKTLLGLAVAISAVASDPDAPRFAIDLLKSLARGLGEAWQADLRTLHRHGEAVSIAVGGKRYVVTDAAARRVGAEICDLVVIPLIQDIFTPTVGMN